MTVLEIAKAHNWNMPTVCPVCGSPLEINSSGVLFCPNKICEQKVLHKIGKMTQVWNVLEIGPSIIKDFVEAENITSNFQFLDKLNNNSLDEICGKNADKIRANFKKVLAQPMTTANFLAAFDLDGYGRRSIQSLVDEGFTLSDLLLPENKFAIGKIKGWTVESGAELIDLILENKEDILTVKNMVTISDVVETKVGKFTGLSFCFTGSNDFNPDEKRKVLEAKVAELGGTISSVKKGLSYLVSSETGTAKMIKAEKDGVPTITYEEFYKMLEA